MSSGDGMPFEIQLPEIAAEANAKEAAVGEQAAAKGGVVGLLADDYASSDEDSGNEDGSDGRQPATGAQKAGGTVEKFVPSRNFDLPGPDAAFESVKEAPPSFLKRIQSESDTVVEVDAEPEPIVPNTLPAATVAAAATSRGRDEDEGPSLQAGKPQGRANGGTGTGNGSSGGASKGDGKGGSFPLADAAIQERRKTNKKQKLTSATGADGQRLTVKERIKEKRVRNQDAHGGVWKTDEEMRLRQQID